jgi:hypothetical protein
MARSVHISEQAREDFYSEAGVNKLTGCFWMENFNCVLYLYLHLNLESDYASILLRAMLLTL